MNITIATSFKDNVISAGANTRLTPSEAAEPFAKLFEILMSSVSYNGKYAKMKLTDSKHVKSLTDHSNSGGEARKPYKQNNQMLGSTVHAGKKKQ